MEKDAKETLQKFRHKHGDSCLYHGDYKERLIHVAPDMLWFEVQDIGSYQGSIYGVLVYGGEIGIYEDYYGSCSGCGAWGEGGGPHSQEEVLKKCHFFKTTTEAIEFVKQLDSYEHPDEEKMNAAIEDANDYIQKHSQKV